jgi:hypothetical protein
MTLAADFLTHLEAATTSAWANTPDLRSLWHGDWTQFMLGKKAGLLVRVSNAWATAYLKNDDFSQYWEKRRFDLMITTPRFSETLEGWRTHPLLTLEHEHRDDTYVETWGLAHWRSALKVIVTYHATPGVLEEKLRRAADILRTSDQNFGTTSDEFLFVSASRSFNATMKWEAREWVGDWRKVEHAG